jgi:hypothetical protein
MRDEIEYGLTHLCYILRHSFSVLGRSPFHALQVYSGRFDRRHIYCGHVGQIVRTLKNPSAHTGSELSTQKRPRIINHAITYP